MDRNNCKFDSSLSRECFNVKLYTTDKQVSSITCHKNLLKLNCLMRNCSLCTVNYDMIPILSTPRKDKILVLCKQDEQIPLFTLWSKVQMFESVLSQTASLPRTPAEGQSGCWSGQEHEQHCLCLHTDCIHFGHGLYPITHLI